MSRGLICTVLLCVSVAAQEDADVDSALHFNEFTKCWSDRNSSCVQLVEDVLEAAGDIHLTDSLVIQRLSNDTEGEGHTDEEEEQVSQGRSSDPLMDNIGRLLKNRVIKLNIWDMATLRMSRSRDQPDSLEFILDSAPAEGRGSANRMSKVIVPLVLGFKLTGALLLAISAVKVFLVKTFVLSKLALLAALYLLVKKLLSAVGVQHHPYLYSKHPIPTYYPHHGGLEASLPADYGYVPYHAGYEGHQYPSVQDYGQYQGQYAPSSAGSEVAAQADDLQAHFSHNKVQAVQPSSATQRNGTVELSRADESKRRVYGLIKSSAHRVPVNTYRKLVSTGRTLSSDRR